MVQNRIENGGTTLLLRRYAVLSLTRLPKRTEIVCVRGTLWVTFRGDREDHILQPGDSLPTLGRRRPVVYALSRAELLLVARAALLRRTAGSRRGAALARFRLLLPIQSAHT